MEEITYYISNMFAGNGQHNIALPKNSYFFFWFGETYIAYDNGMRAPIV